MMKALPASWGNARLLVSGEALAASAVAKKWRRLIISILPQGLDSVGASVLRSIELDQ
jgi:hypothetical protein